MDLRSWSAYVWRWTKTKREITATFPGIRLWKWKKMYVNVCVWGSVTVCHVPFEPWSVRSDAPINGRPFWKKWQAEVTTSRQQMGSMEEELCRFGLGAAAAPAGALSSIGIPNPKIFSIDTNRIPSSWYVDVWRLIHTKTSVSLVWIITPCFYLLSAKHSLARLDIYILHLVVEFMQFGQNSMQ